VRGATKRIALSTYANRPQGRTDQGRLLRELHPKSLVGIAAYLRPCLSRADAKGREEKTKCLLGNADIHVHRDRRAKVPEAQRLCRCCAEGALEGVFHYLFTCPSRAHLLAELKVALRVDPGTRPAALFVRLMSAN